MWLTTTGGFYSAVQDRDDSNMLLVRSRDRESAQLLVDGVETLCGVTAEIRERGSVDYPYRVSVSKENFAEWVAHEVLSYITYDNFKSAVSECRGIVWSEALSKVWAAMQGVTDPEMQDHGYYGGWSNPHYAQSAWADDV